MLTKPIFPKTPVDVEVILREHLPDVDLEQYLDFTEDDQHLIIKIMRYLPGDTWNVIMSLVQEWGGDYDKPKRWWLIPKKQEPPESTPSVEEPETHESIAGQQMTVEPIPLESITPSPFQIRQEISEEEIDELAESIRKHGLQHPITVRPTSDGSYEVVTGERRFRAIQKLALATIPCVVKNLSDVEVMERQFTENDQRKDPCDYTTAVRLDHMLRNYPDRYPTQEALAKRFGKTRSWIANNIRMLQLTNIVSTETMVKLTESHTRAILEAPPEMRKEIVAYVERHINQEGAPPSVREIKWETERITAISLGLPLKTQETSETPNRSRKGKKKWTRCPRCGQSFRHHRRYDTWK